MYDGPIEVRDTLFDGVTVEPSNGSWSAPWVCEGQSAAAIPSRASARIRRSSSTPARASSSPRDRGAEQLRRAVRLAGEMRLREQGRDSDPPGGTPQNTNAGDDTATAEVKFAPFEKHGQKFCEPGLTTATAAGLPSRLVAHARAGKMLPAAQRLGRRAMQARRNASRGEVPAGLG